MSALRTDGSGRGIPFVFDGRRLEGRDGDTIASALIANDVRVVGRSFKYHRPRGIWGFWTEEPNAIVDIEIDGRSTPNLRATTERLTDGMKVRSVNASPDAASDRGRALDLLARFIPAGFYYKTFMWPNWRRFEPSIRAMAGLGRLDASHAPPADIPHVSRHCDVLVIGAGPAGIAAARAAARRGDDVVLVDDRARAGGSLTWRDAMIDGAVGEEWAAEAMAVIARAGASVLARATAFGIYDHRLTGIWERRERAPDRLWMIRPRRVVLAAGAIERPLVFPDNDRPGVMSAEAGLAYLRLHDLLVGERIVMATCNDAAYGAATALAAAGAHVIVADMRDDTSAAADGIEVLRGASVTAVHGSRGVEAVTVGGRRIEADALLASGGFTPTVHLHCQAGGRLRYDPAIAAPRPSAPLADMRVVGAANGTLDLSMALAEGHAAGGGEGAPPHAARSEARGIVAAWPKPGAAGRQWIDFQNDVTLKDVELAARENFRSVEHLKRYTTLGMATDQGKTSNLNGLAAMAAITGRTIEETGTTTYRPPFIPVPLTVLAGRRRGALFNPVKRLTLENLHRAEGARLREYGGWLRPACYGPDAGAIAREAGQARETVAIFDGSPLGKIELLGPGAAALADFNSYNRMSNIAPGRIRYGFMLTEAGVVQDDGVTLRLADDRFLVSCSSGHVAGVSLRLEEFRQDRFDAGRVVVRDLTAQWATLTATGPRARALVDALGLGVDTSDAALPHMAFAEGRFGNAPARIARVSFTGDRSYEISVPTSRAAALWQAMKEAGRPLDAALLGLEALLILRAEKGFIVAGKDTDGATMPHDLGMSGPRDRREDEYCGKRSLFTETAMRHDRNQLVGFAVDEAATPLPTGAHVVETHRGRRRSLGFVTSSYPSPNLARPVALGLLERGRERLGERVELLHLGSRLEAIVAEPCAFDPDGERLDV